MAQVNLGHVVGPGVPTGGTAGQVLKKNGSTNYDTSWATLNSGNIPISASDNTTVQQSLAAVKSDMGIVEDGNTATHTIAAGQYVIWKGALYTASAAIPAGTTLSTSNLTAVSGGGLNALNGNIEKKLSGASFVTFQTSAGTSVTLNLPQGFRGILLSSSAYGNSVGIFNIITSSAGTAGTSSIVGGSDIIFGTSVSGKLTVSSSNWTLYALIAIGSTVTIAS